MYIIEILKERVKNELRIELMIELSGQLNEEDLSQLIESKLSKMDDILPKQGDKPLDPTKCHARAWTGKRGCHDIESIDTIVRYQRMNIHKLAKQRKITPQ